MAHQFLHPVGDAGGYYRQNITYPTITLWSEPAFDLTANIHQPAPGVLMHFVHMEVYRWTADTLRSMSANWPAVRSTLPDIIYSCPTVDDDKFVRFAGYFGWKPLSTANCTDGHCRRIYIHLKDYDGRKQ